MSGLLLAFVGALLGGLLALVEWQRRHQHSAEALLTAFAADTHVLCSLIDSLGFIRIYMAEQQVDAEHASFPTFPARADYGALFASLSPRLGVLRPRQAATITMFYQRLRVALDTANPDTRYSAATGESALHLSRFMIYQLADVVRLGGLI